MVNDLYCIQSTVLMMKHTIGILKYAYNYIDETQH